MKILLIGFADKLNVETEGRGGIRDDAEGLGRVTRRLKMPLTKKGRLQGEQDSGRKLELSFGYAKFEMPVGKLSGDIE